jgi:hypothetical protein
MLGLGINLNLTMQHNKGEPNCIKYVVEINPWKTSSQFDFVYETWPCTWCFYVELVLICIVHYIMHKSCNYRLDSLD